MGTFVKHTRCNLLIGLTPDGRSICCDRPRCEEAGRRSLCLEHWHAQEVKRQQGRVSAIQSASKSSA
jgi:hypothetical protein